jgi:hypothetical protein
VGICQVSTANGDRIQNRQGILEETQYGGRLDIAQLESHQKSKKEQEDHLALLQSVDKELSRQRGRRVQKDNQNQRKHKIQISRMTSDHSSTCTVESPSETLQNTPAINFPRKAHIFKNLFMIQIARIPQVK